MVASCTFKKLYRLRPTVQHQVAISLNPACGCASSRFAGESLRAEFVRPSAFAGSAGCYGGNARPNNGDVGGIPNTSTASVEACERDDKPNGG